MCVVPCYWKGHATVLDNSVVKEGGHTLTQEVDSNESSASPPNCPKTLRGIKKHKVKKKTRGEDSYSL